MPSDQKSPCRYGKPAANDQAGSAARSATHTETEKTEEAMSAPKFTPGPYCWDDGYLYGPNRKEFSLPIVVAVDCTEGTKSLLAAAPDLYRERQRILTIIDGMEQEPDLKFPSEDRWHQPTIDELRRRIEGKP